MNRVILFVVTVLALPNGTAPLAQETRSALECIPYDGSGCSTQEVVNRLPRDGDGNVILVEYDENGNRTEHRVGSGHVRPLPEWRWPASSPHRGVLTCFKVCASEGIGKRIAESPVWNRFCQAR